MRSFVARVAGDGTEPFAGDQHCGDLVGADRLGVEVALAEQAAQGPQVVALCLALYPLGDDVESKGVCERYDHSRERAAIGVESAESIHEGLVDLDAVNR